jgi:hypothetical protein
VRRGDDLLLLAAGVLKVADGHFGNSDRSLRLIGDPATARGGATRKTAVADASPARSVASSHRPVMTSPPLDTPEGRTGRWG